MKKTLLLLLAVFAITGSQAQKYIKFIPVSESSPGACDAKILTQQYGSNVTSAYISRMSDGTILGQAMSIEDLCSDDKYYFRMLDTLCYRNESHIYIYPNPAQQPQLDTLLIQMPEVDSCDGSITILFDNLPASYSFMLNAPLGTVTPTSPGVYTNLCEDIYEMRLHDNNITGLTVYQTWVDLRHNVSPCYPFSVTIDPTPVTGTACNGEMQIETVGGIDSLGWYVELYHPSVSISDSGGFYQDSLCKGLYTVIVQNYSGNIYRSDFYYFLGNSAPPISFGLPTSIPSGTDSIQLISAPNCDIDYTEPIDTAYINAINYIDPTQFEVEITIVQNPDTVNLTYMIPGDTGQSYLLQFTLFCNDPTRANNNYNFAMYIPSTGEQLTTGEINENKSAIQLYPNPAANKIHLEGELEDAQIEIISVNGSLLKQIEKYKAGAPIDIEFLPPGYYTIICKAQSGIRYTEKFVKTK